MPITAINSFKFASCSLVTHAAVDAEYFRRILSIHEELVHVTVKVERIEPMPL